MTESNKSALIVGASGLIGKELLKYLLESPVYSTVKIFVRKQINIEHPKLEQIMVDFKQLAAYSKDFQVNDVYCCLGTTIKKAGSQAEFRKVDFEYPVSLGKLAKQNGAQKFLMITALGADKSSRIFYNRVKGEVEEAVKKIGLPSLHIFQPSLLLGERTEFRLGEKMAIWLSPVLSIFFVGGLRKYRPIQAKDVAYAMYLVAQKPFLGTHTYTSSQINFVIGNGA